nr:hypothetical protein [Tanacetum cinerariifolium]
MTLVASTSTSKLLKEFDELMSTLIDFSSYILNNLKIKNMTQEILLGPAFRLFKRTHSNYAKLEYNFEECYKALSEKLDWETTEGGDYPFDLSKPLPLITRGNHQSIPVEYLINNDHKYLQGGVSTMTYMTSNTKTKAAQYDLPGIKEMAINTIPRGLKPKEETFQVVLDALALTPCYPAFVITADVPKIYMHQFWNSVYKHHNFYRFKFNKKKRFKLTLEVFRDIFQICPRIKDQAFDALPSEEDTISFLRELGHTGVINSLNDESKAYKTYLSYATGTVPPKVAKTFKKASPSKKDNVPVPAYEEPVQKGKSVKRSAKKSSTTPTTCIVIREPPVETQSKRNEKVDVAHGKGIDLLSEVALTKEAQMKEVRNNSLRDFYKSHPSSSSSVSCKPPSVEKITPPITSKGTGSERENDSEEHESDYEQDTDGSESDSESDQQDDDDEVKDDDNDDDKYEGDEDRGMDSDDV